MIIGTGAAARNHVRAFKAAGADICLYGTSLSRTRELCKSEDIQQVFDLDSLIAGGEVQAAVIASIPMLNGPYAAACLISQIPVLIEKPVSLSSSYARILASHAKRFSTQAAAAHVLRCADVFLKLRSILNQNGFGRIRTWRDVRNAWRPTAERIWWPNFCGHVFAFQGIHAIDLVQWTIGLDFEELSLRQSEKSSETNWYLAFTLAGRSAEGARLSIEHSFAHVGEPVNCITVVCDRATIAVKDFRYLELDGKPEFDAGPQWLDRALQRQAQTFLASNPACSLEDACKTVSILELANRDVE